MFPDREIDGGVARVVETTFAVTFHQRFGLVRAGQIAVTVGGQHVIEQAEMVGNRFGELAVRGGDQHQSAALRLLLAEKGEQFRVVGQSPDVQFHPLGDLRFEVRLTIGQPARPVQDG